MVENMNRLSQHILSGDEVEAIEAVEQTGAPLQEGLTYYVANRRKITEALGKLDEITECILKLPSFHNANEDIAEHRKSIRASQRGVLPLEVLTSTILDSDRADWEREPSLYAAVMVEMIPITQRIQKHLSQGVDGQVVF